MNGQSTTRELHQDRSGEVVCRLDAPGIIVSPSGNLWRCRSRTSLSRQCLITRRRYLFIVVRLRCALRSLLNDVNRKSTAEQKSTPLLQWPLILLFTVHFATLQSVVYKCCSRINQLKQIMSIHKIWF